MDKKEQVYRDLQKHLDKQAVGYPSTKTGAEIRLLKRFFTPDEALLAIHLNYKPKVVEEIYETAKGTGNSFDDMLNMLDRMAKNGVIGHIEKEGTRYFYTLPFVVGMFEGQIYKLTPEFIADVREYISDKAFGLEFLSTELPQMRTIPVGKSIRQEHHIATYDQLTNIINETDGPIVINECICRKMAAMSGNPCQKTSRLETCMAFGNIAKNCVRAGMGRVIGKEEARDIAGQNEFEGLVLQPSNTRKVEFVCACCGCCCGMLRVHKILAKPLSFWSTNYYATVSPGDCTGCGACADRCQVHAVRTNKSSGIPDVNRDRCIGCGNCVSSCPSGAIYLVKNGEETIPPADSEDLYDTIMANKKTTLRKIRLAARLILKK
ncbi:MAG: Ferredoxin-1 [Syntrophorhabdus sp. PtaB.Bin006]|nr:MAG: Ferredoxin-1 [Syntrophorhabdus sp. PtaB.Bin006]